MKKLRTHYDNLMVARNASEEVIKAAYRTLSQKYHPDRNSNNEESGRIMKILNESYSVLSDPEKKLEHDKWISGHGDIEVFTDTGSDHFAESDVSNTGSLSPVSGNYLFSELSSDLRYKVLSRISGINRNQMAVKMESAWWRYFWLLFLSGWFVFLFNDANSFRWGLERAYTYLSLSLVAAILFARNLHWVLFWSFTQLGSWLIVTPLYVIRTKFNQVSFWPLLSISNVEINYNHRRGVYRDTSLTIYFDGKPVKFKIPSEPELQGLLNKLNVFDQTLRGAVNQNNVDYLVENDDFLELKVRGRKNLPRKWTHLMVAVIYLITVSALCYTSYHLLQLNRERPIEPVKVETLERNENEQTGSSQMIDQKASPRVNSGQELALSTRKPWEDPGYKRPALAPNGLIWPSKAGYLKNVEKLNNDGLSKVTVDNTENSSDVFVKLISLDGTAGRMSPFTTRSFYIPAQKEFALEDIRPGLYEIRYQNLESGRSIISDKFLLEESQISEGFRYSDIVISLEK